MKDKIEIEKCEIDTRQDILEIEISGELSFAIRGERFRLAAVFCGTHVNRYFPMTAYGTVSEIGTTQFHSSVSVQLNTVFYEYSPEAGEEITLKFCICSPEKTWITIDTNKRWKAELFQTDSVQEGETGSLLRRFGKKLQYILCTLLLPVWILQGLLAVRGYGKLHPSAQGRSGWKAALYHAHGLVSGWTGYGYSIRELKTAYFREQYEKYCVYYPETKGVLFLSERRTEPGGNLYLVRKALMELSEGERREYGEIQDFLVERPVSRLRWKELKRCAALAARSRVIVLEDFYPQLHALTIRQETNILQMWHACGAFKLFGLSDLGIAKHLEQSTRNHRNYDAALSSSEGVVPFYSEAYGVPQERIYPIGVPRTDIFFDSGAAEEIRAGLYQKYPICRDKRIVLFAPTFRGSGKQTAYYPLEKFPVEEIMESLPKDVVLILKNHPFMKEPFPVGGKYRERVLDLSAEEHINDILFITDLLITDYSSTIFEASLLNIPMIFYVFDLEEYLAERDIYFDFASFVPGAIVGELPELIREINASLVQGASAECDEKFRSFFLGALDGHSTERTLELIKRLYRQDAINGREDGIDGGDTMFQKWTKELDLLEEGKSRYEWDELEELITDDFEEEKLSEEEFDRLMKRLMELDDFI